MNVPEYKGPGTPAHLTMKNAWDAKTTYEKRRFVSEYLLGKNYTNYYRLLRKEQLEEWDATRV